MKLYYILLISTWVCMVIQGIYMYSTQQNLVRIISKYQIQKDENEYIWKLIKGGKSFMPKDETTLYKCKYFGEL